MSRMTGLRANSMKELLDNLRRANFITSAAIYDVMMRVDRALFCPIDPYFDAPQSIGYSVTISAPHMHAYSLEKLADNLRPGSRVLDVGSGSGYLSACMAYMVQPMGLVFCVEHIKGLVERSIENLNRLDPHLLGDGLISITEADGRLGNAQNGPYDVIHVGAACPSIPYSLIDQLKIGGVLLAPIGTTRQQVVKCTKGEGGAVNEEYLIDAIYVPLTDKKIQINRNELTGHIEIN
ncbi:hypothetical protein ACOME3_003639 [Neoechinorhynchus agilis]